MRRRYNNYELVGPIGLKLHAWDCDGQRFAQLFQEAWRLLPDEALRDLVQLFDAVSLVVELLDFWGDSSLYGQVKTDLLNGKIIELSIRFRADAFSHLPRKAALWVIGHELAHAYQKARGRLAIENEAENEGLADLLAASWGFRRGCFALIELIRSTRGISLEEACIEYAQTQASDQRSAPAGSGL